MSLALTSIGVTTYYTIGKLTKDAEGKYVEVPTDKKFIQIPDVREIPDMSPDPDTIEVTSLEDTEYKRYRPALRDLGGVLSYTTNLTQEIIDEWNGRAFVKTTDTTPQAGKTYYKKEGVDYIPVKNPTDIEDNFYEHQEPSSDKYSVMYQDAHLEEDETLWICHIHPDLNQATYMPFDPVKIMQPAMSVNSNVDNSLKVVPTGEPVWDIKPTDIVTYEEYIKGEPLKSVN